MPIQTPPPRSRLLELIEEKKARDAKLAEQNAPEKFDDDLIPDIGYEKTEGQQKLDDFVNSIGIIDAYNKWCGKMRPTVRPGQVESIKVSCPNPAHPDKGPSAWVNIEKNTGICRPCGDMGFDSHDIAAWAFGFPVPDYKKNGDFPKLRKMMAESFGMHVETTLAGETLVYEESVPETDKTDTPPIAPKSTSSDEPDKTDIPAAPTGEISAVKTKDSENQTDEQDLAPVTDLYEDEESYEVKLPELDWRKLLPGTATFLDLYMEACCGDEAPEEYHYFNALMAIGFVAGHDVTLRSKSPVFGNLFVCHLGKTGAGKSTSMRHLKTIIRKHLPYSATDPNSKGIDTITGDSAESLIKAFSKPVPDPVDPKRIAYYASVRGLIEYPELSSLIGRAARQGNILKPILMEMYDNSAKVQTQSISGGKIIAENPFATCSTTVQPRALRDLLRNSDDASGFLNRWLFVGGTPKQSTIMGTGPVDLSAAGDALDKLKGWCASFKTSEQITWSEESLAAMQTFFNEVVYPLKADQDTNIYTRMDLLCLKLTLLLSINKKEKVVTVDTVEKVKSMFKYIQVCYQATSGQIGNTLEHEMTEAIVYQMKRIGGKDGASLNAIALALKRRKYPKELILRNIKSLIELGFVEERTNAAGTRGRPSKRYVYVA